MENNAINDIIVPDELFEGVVPHFYLDTVGLVTCAAGLMVPDAKHATLLPFVHGDGTTATAGEKMSDWTRVKAMPPGRLPNFYAVPGQIMLSSASIASLLRSKEEDFWGYLLQLFPALDSYPEPAQLALLDMMYNLGPQRFLEFKLLRAAVARRDWQTAAGQCNRPQVSQARNQWTRLRFMAAAQG